MPGRYIILLESGADGAQVAAEHGLSVDHQYVALGAISAKGGPGKLKALRADPRVAVVEADRVVRIQQDDVHEAGSGKTDPFASATSSQTVPTGVRRIGGASSPTAGIDGVEGRLDIDVAIIDTGIQTNHPDLNVVGGVNCAVGKNFTDGHGHGTHVAGTVAAKDNGFGAVGVAPGARLWSVRVLDNTGSGLISWIICGVDWVTANSGKVKVANMSLGFSGSSPALDAAISRSVAAGVTYVVAAGNSAQDSATFSPANHSDVIAVSALADFDGVGGALGTPTCRPDGDDTLADFSNFGEVVDIAAPGVCIYSTYKKSGYTTLSGTSMASPHVAGAAVLYKALHPTATPAEVKAALLAAAKPQSDPEWGFTGDRDLYPEPVLYVGGF